MIIEKCVELSELNLDTVKMWSKGISCSFINFFFEQNNTYIYPKRPLKKPFFLVVVAGVVVVVVALASIAFTAFFTRPVDVFGVAPAPAPVKIKVFTVRC